MKSKLRSSLLQGLMLLSSVSSALVFAKNKKQSNASKSEPKSLDFESSNSTPERTKGFEFSKFAGLYERQKSFQDTLNRLNKMEDLRLSAQQSLDRLLKVQPGNIDLELRYGELIVSRGRDLEQFALEVEAGGDVKRGKELAATSRGLMQMGLAMHTKILNRARNHPMVPKVYLGMARTQYSLGQKNASLTSADLGIKSLPQKKLGFEETEMQLWMIRGDAAFDESKAAVALESYEHAISLAHQGSVEEAYLHYKLAWVHYNRKNVEIALKHLDRLFEVTRDRYALKAEAVQDYALFMADVSSELIVQRGSYKGIFDYLSKQGEHDAAVKAMERLAKTFAKNGRRNEGIQVNDFLIAETKMSAANVERALTIVEWSHSIADKVLLTEKYFWLINNFGPTSAWYSAQGTGLQVQRNAVDSIELSVRKYALELHAEAQKETNPDLRDKREAVVAKLYDAHIQAFNRSFDVPRADAGRIHYYRAEIHRRKAEYHQAGLRYDQYLRILEVVPATELDKIDLKLKDEAIWGAVQVWAKAIDSDSKLVPHMLGAADRFLKEKGDDPKAAQVLLDAALVEERAGNRVVAARRLENLIHQYPRTSQAVTAVHASLDILNKENDWINLAQRARLFMDSLDKWVPNSEKTKMHGELLKILTQTEAKSCDALKQQAERQLEAALCFERFARGFENDSEAPKALLLSAELYDTLKDAPAALAALEILVKKYPDSEHAARGFSRLAQVYEKAFEFEKAISIYEILLTRNKEIQDREKLLVRLLALLNGLGDNEKLNFWLSKKETPQSTRNEYERRQISQKLLTLRYEENTHGYSDQGGFASPIAQKIFIELSAPKYQNQLATEEVLEIHRIKGVFHRLAGRLDKADEEWMSGMKQFWRAKDKTPAVWESAARLRLEQGSVWETVFQNTDFLKNPTRKAELYQKLEAWYGEVVDMKSPEVALAALWKSAELNSGFAEEVRNAPVPIELSGADNQKQLSLYKSMLVEKTKPMKEKALIIAKKIAEKAREWKVISPEVIAALKMVSNLRSGVELPGKLVHVEERQVLRFPWAELPRWVDLSAEQSAWSEWTSADDDLKKILLSAKRGEARRAAFVKMFRDGNVKDAEVKKWHKTFVDRAGIQVRIQAMIQEGDFNRAGLFLDQYESFFGNDSFSQHFWGSLEWARENYSLAYLKWVRPQGKITDFRSAYWSEGWNTLLDNLVSGAPNSGRQNEVFSRLAPLAETAWQKHLLIKLCLDEQAQCQEQFSFDRMAEFIFKNPELELAFKFEDGKSSFEIQKNIASRYILMGLPTADKFEKVERLRRALSGYYNLNRYTSNAGKDVLGEYYALKKQIDARQDMIDNANKKRVLAGFSETGDSK